MVLPKYIFEYILYVYICIHMEKWVWCIFMLTGTLWTKITHKNKDNMHRNKWGSSISTILRLIIHPQSPWDQFGRSSLNLLCFYGKVITQEWSIKSLAIRYQFKLWSFSHCVRMGDKIESYKPLIKPSVSTDQPWYWTKPSLAMQWPTHLGTKYITLETPKVLHFFFGQKLGMKPYI